MATTRATDLGNAYYSVKYRASRQVSDLLRGDFDGEDLPILIVIGYNDEYRQIFSIEVTP